jgi:hypothetical protein
MSATPENLAWERSSFCSDSACVEVAIERDAVYVRNSESPDNVVRFTRREWKIFAQGVAAGQLR